MPPTIDLFTEIRKDPKVPVPLEAPSAFLNNLLFLNNNILFKYCTEMKIALPDGDLGACPGAYSQSYPQNLWVSHFLLCSNSLSNYANTFSSICRQATDLT